MNGRRKWLIGFTVTLIFALISLGSSIIFHMDASFLRTQNIKLKDELHQRLGELQASADHAEALNRQINGLKDKLQSAREELDSMDEEMRAQKERLGLDFQEQVTKERRKVKELKQINDQQREGIFQPKPYKPWKEQLEAMKTENPERYRKIMETRAKMKQQWEEDNQRRNHLLDELEHSDLPKEKLTAVKRYRELNDKMLNLKANANSMTPEERQQIWQEGQQAFQEMNELKLTVRDELFDQAVKHGQTEQAKEILELFPGPRLRRKRVVRRP